MVEVGNEISARKCLAESGRVRASRKQPSTEPGPKFMVCPNCKEMVREGLCGESSCYHDSGSGFGGWYNCKERAAPYSEFM